MRLTLLIANLVCAFACVSSVDAIAGEKETIRYKGGLKNTVEEFVLPKNGNINSFVRHARDASSSSSFCADSSSFFCIRSFSLTFAVPKCLPDEKTEWDFEDNLYKVIDSNMEVTLFGHTFGNLYLIEVPSEASVIGRQTTTSTLVLFSRKVGVIGYAQDDSHGPTSTFWLVSDYGLGSNLDQTAFCGSSSNIKSGSNRGIIEQ
ncbi:MAG: hypothetical protein DRR42_17345 [Gammaproteobacteria bacterium]|nr:MAG: hypothetical protein DRR42_17345 [Gammaproteobacteria bacterium]